MWAGGHTRRADEADGRADHDALTDPNPDPGQMRIAGADPLSVVDDDELAPPAAARTREDDSARTGRGDRGSGRCRKVEPCMEPRAPRPERISDRPREGAREPEWGSRQRRPQRGERGRPGQAGLIDSGPSLEAPQRRIRMPPGEAVERCRGKSVPGESELQRGDVPACHGQAEGAKAGRRAGAVTAK